VPDIIVQPQMGVVYTTSSTKLAEHGGFTHDDTNVMLLVSNPGFGNSRSITTHVETAQVAPTILEALGLNPQRLDAVQIEGTQVLPGLFTDAGGNGTDGD
jgi:arylsulfatase A-like enzyme